jgi:hypothetical protein
MEREEEGEGRRKKGERREMERKGRNGRDKLIFYFLWATHKFIGNFCYRPLYGLLITLVLLF